MPYYCTSPIQFAQQVLTCYKALPPTSILAEEASGELSLCEEGMYIHFLWNIFNPVLMYDVLVLAR